MANEVRVLLFAAVVSAGHPAGSAVAVDESAPLARHAATFTTFCDTGSVSDGSCWCKGGSATAAIGDGSWLWHELVGKECPAQPNDRCDCSAGGGASDDCPHQGNWQCQGINAPQCNADDSLKRCEVTVHGSHGAEKYYITEVCPGQHPCNRCKSAELQRCAAWSPLAVDLCGTTWHLIFEASRSEATGYVTLSCYPNEYAGSDSHPGEAVEPEEEEAATSDRSCYSNMPDDTPDATCENWCDPNWASDHCRYCKCRGCDALAGKCEAIRGELEAQERHRAELFTSCGRRLDCLSWCNIGNCGQCPCASCERCGPAPKLSTAPHTAPTAALANGLAPAPAPALQASAAQKAIELAPADAATKQPAACHGWCIAGGEDDAEVVCQSTKCAACPFCGERHLG